MISQVAKKLNIRYFNFVLIKNFTTTNKNSFNVTVIGAAGGIGQPLSLLLKLNPLATKLNLYDIKGSPGVSADLSHIDTKSECVPFVGDDQLSCALQCADLVVISAGLPRKPGMTRDDLFDKNAELIYKLATEISKMCPEAFVGIITNPLNIMLPLAAEVLKKAGTYDPKRLIGISGLDSVRARAFLGHAMKIDPKKVNIPVIGGHSPETIIPIISQCRPAFRGDDDVIEALTQRIQHAGTEVVKAKDGVGSATLSMAHAAAGLSNSILKALNGDKVRDVAYVESSITEAKFFSSHIIIGKDGVEEYLDLPDMNCYEQGLLDKAFPVLKKNIKKGIDFVNEKC